MTASPHLNRVAGDGFCVLEGVIPGGAAGAVRDSVLATAAAHKAADPRSRLDKVSGLINFDQSFAQYLAEPRLLGLCKALLGEHVRVSYTTCMVTHPGNERGAWHADWPFNQQNAGCVQAPYPDAVMHLTTIWMLTPFTANTGTLVVPGSHRLGNNPSGNSGVDPHQPHPHEVAVEGGCRLRARHGQQAVARHQSEPVRRAPRGLAGPVRPVVAEPRLPAARFGRARAPDRRGVVGERGAAGARPGVRPAARRGEAAVPPLGGPFLRDIDPGDRPAPNPTGSGGTLQDDSIPSGFRRIVLSNGTKKGARVELDAWNSSLCGSGGGTRTPDTWIMIPLL